jgi:hypothetical protein
MMGELSGGPGQNGVLLVMPEQPRVPHGEDLDVPTGELHGVPHRHVGEGSVAGQLLIRIRILLVV